MTTPLTVDDDSPAQGAHILIVEDDPELARALRAYLTSLHYVVSWAADGASGLDMALKGRPDLALLDVGLPVMSGYEVCHRLRAESDVLIIFLTSASSEEDIVTGLYQGADGYICKPCGLAELVARIEALLRRARQRQPPRPHAYDDGVLRVDIEQGIVRKRGQDLPMAPREMRLLLYLVRHAGEVVPHSELLQVVWGTAYKESRSYLALYIRYLRAKIEDDPAEPRYLLTRFGVGYCFCPAEEGMRAQPSALTQCPF